MPCFWRIVENAIRILLSCPNLLHERTQNLPWILTVGATGWKACIRLWGPICKRKKIYLETAPFFIASVGGKKNSLSLGSQAAVQMQWSCILPEAGGQFSPAAQGSQCHIHSLAGHLGAIYNVRESMFWHASEMLLLRQMRKKEMKNTKLPTSSCLCCNVMFDEQALHVWFTFLPKGPDMGKQVPDSSPSFTTYLPRKSGISLRHRAPG